LHILLHKVAHWLLNDMKIIDLGWPWSVLQQ